MTHLPPPLKPQRPYFSSGPCSKRPLYHLSALSHALQGRSHRAPESRERLRHAIEKTRSLLDIPSDYRIGIVPASDTGAVEMALWSLLGPKPVDVLAWEAFGHIWVSDLKHQLKLPHVRTLSADYGLLPDLSAANPAHDIVFTWNGTTSGVRVPDADFIATDRTGLTICDATSAIFAQDLPWEKLDVVTYSWQKVLGGEAAHGMLILSPRAVQRLISYTPPWPLPKIFQLTHKGALLEGIFQGDTINTPSMLCVEDYLDALEWVERIGGRHATIQRANANANVIYDWAARSSWLSPLAHDPRTFSNTGVCLKLTEPHLATRTPLEQRAFFKQLAHLLASQEVAYDIEAYRDAPPGLRIWCGSTVEAQDLSCLTLWLDWARDEIISDATS